MSERVDFVDLATPEGRGLWQLETSSTTVYYLDAREGLPPRLLRAAGQSRTTVTSGDYRWVRLLSLVSGPRVVDGDRELNRDEIDFDDVRQRVLRVGSRHQYEWETMLTDDWVIQRVLEKIVRLGVMPPPARLTRDRDEEDLAGRWDL